MTDPSREPPETVFPADRTMSQIPANPYQTAAVASQPMSGMGGLQPLVQRAGMIKIVGIGLIIFGVLQCLTIIGAIVGIPMILAGVKAQAAGKALENGRGADPHSNQVASENLASYFQITGILTIIGLIFVALYILALIAMIVLAAVGGAANAGA